MLYRALVAFGLTVAIAPIPAALAQQPAVGLVLDVRGATEPALKAYREVRAGDSVKLGSGAKLVVLQYSQPGTECRTLTVEGGAVTFRERGEPVINGGVSSAKDAKCPVKMMAKSTSGAVVLRSSGASLGAAPKVTAAPSFVLAGVRGGDVGSLRVLDRNRKVTEVPVQSEKFTWPTTTPKLAENQTYRIEFLARDNTAVIAWVDVHTSASADAEAPTYVFID